VAQLAERDICGSPEQEHFYQGCGGGRQMSDFDLSKISDSNCLKLT